MLTPIILWKISASLSTLLKTQEDSIEESNHLMFYSLSTQRTGWEAPATEADSQISNITKKLLIC